MVFFIMMLNEAVSAQKNVRIEVSNPSSLSFKEEVIAISWAKVLKLMPSIDTANFVVYDESGKIEIPHQLEYRGGKQVQNLLLQVSVPQKSKLILLLKKGKPQTCTTKTYARYVPERKDDFAWENDKIAFRMYGKALEKTRENAHGIDVWTKSTTRMVLNERYKSNKYHVDNGDGLDYYHVGNTLGAGNLAPYLADSVWYLGNYSSYKILDNGPLRSTFQLFYDEAAANGIKIKNSKMITLNAGSQMNRIENIYSSESSIDLPLAIGIITRGEPRKNTLQDKDGIMAYWEPEHGKDGIIGVGAIIAKKPQRFVDTNKQLLMITSTKPNEKLVYYTGAAWNKAAEITNSQQWFEYLSNFRKKLTQPLIVKIQ